MSKPSTAALRASTAKSRNSTPVYVDPRRIVNSGTVALDGLAPPEPLTAQGTPAPQQENAADILLKAAHTIALRAAQRDNTGGAGERSMAATVAAFNAIEGTTLTERQGWAFMQMLKLARAASSARNGQHDADSHLDGAAYAALAGEAASAEECARRVGMEGLQP